MSLTKRKGVTLPWSSSAFAHEPGRLMRQCLRGRNATVTDLSMVKVKYIKTKMARKGGRMGKKVKKDVECVAA